MCLSIKRFCKCRGVYDSQLVSPFYFLPRGTFSNSNFPPFSDRQSKINSESQQSEEVVVISSKRSTAAKVSNICIAPIETSASVSQQSSVISSVDEGGFNEPSPEIKAKLKPAYSFESTASADTSLPETKDDFNENDYNAHQHSLHYVDFGYRLNPDGSESKQCFSEETDEYVTARNHSVVEEHETVASNVVLKKTTVHYPVTDSVVYASIKSEPTSLSPPPPPPPTLAQPIESKYNCVNRNYRIEDDYANDADNVSDIDEQFEQIYSSTANDKDDDDVDLNGDADDDDDQAAFDLDNVEFADASEKDDLLPDAMTSYEADRLLSSR